MKAQMKVIKKTWGFIKGNNVQAKNLVHEEVEVNQGKQGDLEIQEEKRAWAENHRGNDKK